jgi:hypothetical protein
MCPTPRPIENRPSPRARIALLLIAMLAVIGLATAHAGVVTVACSRDNTLFQDAEGDTSNGSGPAFFAGRNNQGLARRALVRFDLLGVVPAGVILDDAVLQLEVTSAPDAITRSIALHRVLADWGEGTSSSSGGGGAPATPGDATWLHTSYPSQFWSQPGGDFEPTPSAATLVGDVDTYTWTGPALRADVEGWLANPETNFGWLLLGDETAARTVRRFESRESATPAFRPVLHLFYSEPVPSRPTTWGRLKSRFR